MRDLRNLVPPAPLFCAAASSGRLRRGRRPATWGRVGRSIPRVAMLAACGLRRVSLQILRIWPMAEVGQGMPFTPRVKRGERADDRLVDVPRFGSARPAGTGLECSCGHAATRPGAGRFPVVFVPGLASALVPQRSAQGIPLLLDEVAAGRSTKPLVRPGINACQAERLPAKIAWPATDRLICRIRLDVGRRRAAPVPVVLRARLHACGAAAACPTIACALSDRGPRKEGRRSPRGGPPGTGDSRSGPVDDLEPTTWRWLKAAAWIRAQPATRCGGLRAFICSPERILCARSLTTRWLGNKKQLGRQATGF